MSKGRVVYFNGELVAVPTFEFPISLTAEYQ